LSHLQEAVNVMRQCFVDRMKTVLYSEWAEVANFMVDQFAMQTQ